MHTQQCTWLNTQIFYVCVCACSRLCTCTDVSMSVKEGIYWPHGGSHINIINLNYIGLFVYQPAQTQFS